MTKIKLIHDDITSLKVDAIVNAANSSLLGGGGVDGSIHRAAGPGLITECKSLGGCPVGEAKVTSGYNLLAKFVIHAVGPVWHGGKNDEEKLLGDCYKNSLLIASNLKIRSIAFPNISTGIYKFPKELAAKIAISTVKEYIKNSEFPERIIFVTFENENYEIYRRILDTN
jgi:O-acetyl-ADP-ribose deacetylase (regulator of RNase III)